jgi:hypothetical protein
MQIEAAKAAAAYVPPVPTCGQGQSFVQGFGCELTPKPRVKKHVAGAVPVILPVVPVVKQDTPSCDLVAVKRAWNYHDTIHIAFADGMTHITMNWLGLGMNSCDIPTAETIGF